MRSLALRERGLRLTSSSSGLFHLALHVAGLHQVLHQAVLQRVVGDDRQPSARAQGLGGRLEHLAQGLHLVVHLDAQCLEDAGQLLLLAFAAEEGLHDVQELADGGDGGVGPCLGDGGRQLAAVLQLAVEVEHVGQAFLIVGVDDVGRRLSRPLVHAHVQRAVEAEGEAPLAVVEVV